MTNLKKKVSGSSKTALALFIYVRQQKYFKDDLPGFNFILSTMHIYIELSKIETESFWQLLSPSSLYCFYFR